MKIIEHEKRSTGRERWKNEISATWKEETAIWKLFNMVKTQTIGSIAGNQSTMKREYNKERMQHEESSDMNRHNTKERSMKKVQRAWVKYGKIHKNSPL